MTLFFKIILYKKKKRCNLTNCSFFKLYNVFIWQTLPAKKNRDNKHGQSKRGNEMPPRYKPWMLHLHDIHHKPLGHCWSIDYMLAHSYAYSAHCVHTAGSVQVLAFDYSVLDLNSPEKAVLSAISGARLPLPCQEVFGFEVKHVSVCLSLLALAVHAFLRLLHHLLCLLCHLWIP